MLNLYNIKKTYKTGGAEINALNGITLEVNKGDFLAVLGKSGSGKSTLMNLLGCLDRPTAGEYLFLGHPVSNMKPNELSHLRNTAIGFIFQSFNLIPRLTALENVELPLILAGIPKKERKKIALSVLDKVGLSGRASHKPSQMSGGQQQRTAIARALALNPPLILADEPTGNLDPHTGNNILSLLCKLVSDGHTIVLITHDLTVADFASRVVTLEAGKII